MIRFLPGVIGFGLTVGLAVASGVSVSDTLAFFAAFVWTILIPGLAIHRALRGPAASFFLDLGHGVAMGLVLQLPVWAIVTNSGWAWLWWVYPLLSLGIYALTGPKLADWRYAHPLPVATSWVVLAAYSLAVVTVFVTVWQQSTLPPAANTWDQDLYYFLGNAAELGRTTSPLAPQTAIYELHYHWFSSVYMASLSQFSTVSLPIVVSRLWLPPILATVFALLLALSWRLSAAFAPGLIAIVLTATSAQFSPTQWATLPDFNALVFHSPSQIYGLVATAFILDLLIDVARGRLMRWPDWLTLALAILGATGAKSSILPTVFCAMGFVTLFQLRRWRPWAAMGLLTVGLAITLWLAGDSAATSKIKPFVTIGRTGPWNDLANVSTTSGLGGWFSSPSGWLVLTAVAITFALQYSVFLPGLFVWNDPAAKLFAGLGIAGFSTMMLVSHVGLSQVYFWRGVLPFVFLWAGWGLLSQFRSRRPWRAFAVGGAAAVPWFLIVFPPSLTGLWLATGGFLLVLLLAGWRRPIPQVLVAVIAASATFGLLTQIQTVITTAPPRTYVRTVTAAESEAALALQNLAAPLDLVATNVHCREKKTTPNCDARVFWLSGLSQRRVMIEGWAYSDTAQAQAGTGGLPSLNQPFPDAELFAANEDAFYRPSAASIAVLQARGVRWLYADSLAGPVSEELAQFANPRGTFGPVTLYELAQP